MRLCLAVAVLSSSLTAVAAAADPTFPYKARAATDGVRLRCGPGEKYYATERVPPGAEIEVYGHEQGWCKIRPVAGSCSWVSGRHLKLVAKGLGEVLSDGVPSQIGDRSGDIGTAIQVRLKRGEMVEVLGSKQVGSGGSATVWYKDGAPFGRVPLDSRQIHQTAGGPGAGGEIFQRQQHFAAETSHLPSVSEEAAVAVTSGSNERVEAEAPVKPLVKADAVSVPAIVPQPLPWTYERTDGPDLPNPIRSSGSSRLSEARAPAAAQSIQSAETGQTAAGGYQAAWDNANARLTLMLSREPSTWNCEDLARQIDSLSAQVHTAVERVQARQLADRVALAMEIKRRSEMLDVPRSETGRESRQLADVQRARESTARGAVRNDRYDGVGRLRPVKPGKLGEPLYALSDEEGKVRCYVNPAPGVNVRYYLGRWVGINGIRDMADGDTPVVTAKHVTILEAERPTILR